MRQAGIVAAAGVYALDHNIERLAEDHARARSGSRSGSPTPGSQSIRTGSRRTSSSSTSAPRTTEEAIARARRAGRRALGDDPSDGAPRASRTSTWTTTTSMPPSRRSRARSEPVSAPDSLRERLRAPRSRPRSPSSGSRRSARPSSAVTRSSGRRRSDSRTSTGTRATPDTQYRIGSITKTFTAVCVLQLRDAGELSLDDALTRFVPESAHGADARSHARALLRAPARTAGRDLGDAAGADPRGARRRTADAEEVLSPGSWWHYSNLAFAPARRGRRAHRRRHVGGRAAGARSRSARVGANDAEPRRARLRVGYSRRAVLGCRPGRARAGLRRLGRARQALVDDTGPRALGCVPRRRRRPRARRPTLEEMAHVRAMVDHERWAVGWGLGSGSTAPASTYSSATVVPCPGTSRRSSSTARRASARPC